MGRGLSTFGRKLDGVGNRSGLEIFRVEVNDTVHGGSEGGDRLVAGVDEKVSWDVLRRFCKWAGYGKSRLGGGRTSADGNGGRWSRNWF